MKYHLQPRTIWIGFAAVSAALIWASWRHLLPMTLTEVFAFISGVLCVWLTVKENVWNWPIGIINSAFFAWLFWNSRLFADMGLQAVYIILGFLGWYWWLKGGTGRTVLQVSRTGWRTWIMLGVLTVGATWGMTIYLQHIRDAAPFLDALTTVISLDAQYLLTKKLFENWHLWITADVIYIGLYLYKHLYLTSVLYVIFLLMCLAGLREWRATLKRQAAAKGNDHV